MNTINVHLLDSFTDSEFITLTLYPLDQLAKLKVGDFASEFFSIYKGLMNPVKMEISESFRNNKIGDLALQRILELLSEYSGSQCDNGDMGSKEEQKGSFFKIELSSAKQMQKEWWQKTKNLVVAHLEILYITCRCGSQYSYELFRGFENLQELLVLLMQFPDHSTPVDS